MGLKEDFFAKGWAKFPVERRLLEWLEHASPAAMDASEDPVLREDWLRCDGTWFVGVDALPNDADGRVGASDPLTCAALDFAREIAGAPVKPLHRGQVSVTYPGYPRKGREESDGAAKFRRDRDAAHLDGLLAEGADRRRKMREFHGYILGLPASYAAPKAAPLVVWEGSAAYIQAAFREAFANCPQDQWDQLDLTDLYSATRRRIFAECKRVELPALPGEALVLHRQTLHGVAPWEDGAIVDAEGRAVIYFRPEYEGGLHEWLAAP